jgi:hypothetical protein
MSKILSIGWMIRLVREHRQLTERQAAARCDVDLRIYCGWEMSRFIHPKHHAQIAKGLGLKIGVVRALNGKASDPLVEPVRRRS